MNKLSPFLLGLSLAVAGNAVAAAQEMSMATPSMPKVLQITREFIKPYKGGAAHDKTESAFVQAMTRAKFPTHYLALNSLSGKERALFLTAYDSFEAWGKDEKAVDNDKALSAELERASVADGELLESVDSQVFTYNDELSYRPHPVLSQARYMEIYAFHVRPGHGKEWRQVVKLIKDAHVKAGTSAHWAMYEVAYGSEDGTYIALSGDKSMADIDVGFSEDKKFREALGEDGMKNLEQLFAAAVESSRSELFSVNPRQSYVPDNWIKTDPEFWAPKPAADSAAGSAMEEKEDKP
jgi:hypothetical protein